MTTEIKMTTQESNSTMEMGTSDQALVESKRKKRITYIIGGVTMIIVIAVTVTLVVLLSGNEGGTAQPIMGPTTEGTTTVVYTTTEPATAATTPAATTTESIPTTTTEATTTWLPPSPPSPIELDDVLNGVYSTVSFNATWASGSEILFRTANGDLILYDVDTDSTVPIVQNTSEVLQLSTKASQLSADGSNVVIAYNVLPVYRHSFLARYTSIDITTNQPVDITPPSIPSTEAFLQNFQWGPTDTSLAFVYLNNIYYKANLSAEPVQLTSNGQLNVVYNGIPDWVYEEEVFSSYNAMWFSKSGEKLAYVTFDDRNVRVMRVPHYGVPGSVDYQYTQHHEIRYPKPGTTNPTVSVTLRDLGSGVSTTYTAPSSLEQPILKSVSFVTSNSIALTWTDRVQETMLVQLCVEEQVNCTDIFVYNENDGWIDGSNIIFNEAGNAFVTILPQQVGGVLYKQVVQVSDTGAAQWTLSNRINTANTVLDILRWTPDNVIWYKATSVNDSADQHIFTVDQNNNIDCFTCAIQRPDGEPCEFNEGILNDDASRITINCAGPGVPRIYFYNATGELIRPWETNDELSAMVAQQTVPKTLRLQVPTATGYPDADVLLQVPEDYENRTNVPLLVYVYGGPDTALVTKQWNIDWGTSLVSRWGIAIAHIDGRGSGLRGVANAFAVNRQLGTYEIEDQIGVTRYLQTYFSWLDSNRTCIWGWSYGGYAASLALARGGDVFRCAIAVAPVVDWRFYDTIYTERYMDVPLNNTQGYAQSSLLTERVVEAYRNKRYFLVHGTADDNVHYQHAMLFSRLLQKRDVMFSQMTYTDEDHALPGVRPHLYHGLEKFLTDNML